MQIKPESDFKESNREKSDLSTENDILALYRSDIIDLITIFGLRSTDKEIYLKKETLRDFRLLSELIVANLSKYEQKMFQENHIPTHIMNIYDHLMNMIDLVSNQTGPLHDKIHRFLLISSDEFLKIPFFLHEVIHIMKLIVDDLQSEEQGL